MYGILRRKVDELEKRVERLSEVDRRRRQAAFAGHWNSLSQDERQLALAASEELETLLTSGAITTEADCQKWHDEIRNQETHRSSVPR